MATDRDALKALVAVLRERHHGRMPHEVQVAYDEACAALASAPAAEPVGVRSAIARLESVALRLRSTADRGREQLGDGYPEILQSLDTVKASLECLRNAAPPPAEPAQPAPQATRTMMPVPQDAATQAQLAAVLLHRGSPAQQEAALRHVAGVPQPAPQAGAVADGWSVILVNGQFAPLMLALDEAVKNGALPYAIEAEWEGFEYRDAPASSPVPAAVDVGAAQAETAQAAPAATGLLHDEDALHSIERAADLLEGYAEFIKSDVMAADIERHPYLPEVEGVAEELRELSALAAPLMPCGHSRSLMLRSAETGEPLYCEACDDKSGRRDAEEMELALHATNKELSQ